MCTALSLTTGGRHLFCRTLDYERSFGEELLFIPRGYKDDGRARFLRRFAYLGMGCLIDGYPLMFDGVNEHGLCTAGLSFNGDAVYREKREERVNIPSYALTDRILSTCASVAEARALLENGNITDEPFNEGTPPSPLHWIISDSTGSIVVESTEDGLHIYDSHVGVLTNSPEYSYHLTGLAHYSYLSSEYRTNTLCPSVELRAYSRGLGAFGMPGDFSSHSRFVRAVFLKNHTESEYGGDGLSTAFRVMDNLSVPKGTVKTDKGEGVLTFYTAVIDSIRGIYYFSTCKNRRIRACNMQTLVYTNNLLRFSVYENEDVLFIN